jgi:hypothetical protein
VFRLRKYLIQYERRSTVGIKISGIDFNGPFGNTGSLESRSGVYVILDQVNGSYHVHDVGESSDVKSRVEGHNRRDEWNRKSKGKLLVAAYYTPGLQQPGRTLLEQKIRSQYDPPCGKR